MYQFLFKRIIDFILSLIGFILLSPIFLCLWILLSFANKGAGAFYFQERPGKEERLFQVIKFKTMNDKRDKLGNLLPDSNRITSVGRFMRSTSLDEIPQLLNVIKGEMSLIGPRPLLVRYLPFYSNEEKKRHSVRPGITGWAQVNGRNTINWDERLKLDIYYINNISFALDLKIFFKTITNVLTRNNIIVDPESIMKNLDDERKLQN